MWHTRTHSHARKIKLHTVTYDAMCTRENWIECHTQQILKKNLGTQSGRHDYRDVSSLRLSKGLAPTGKEVSQICLQINANMPHLHEIFTMAAH